MAKKNVVTCTHYRCSRQFKEIRQELDENKKMLREMSEMIKQQQEIMSLFYQEYQSLKRRQGKEQLMEYIRMRDSMLKDIAYYENHYQMNERGCRLLRMYVDKITEILEDQSVEILTAGAGELFDPETQKPIERVQAYSPEYNNVVYKVFNCGYRWSGIMLKKMDVSVCVYR